jgi:UDP-glucose 4-epimerase
MIETAKQVTGRDFLVEEAPRRAGDPAVLVAASGKIREIIGWQPIRSSVETIIADAWNWHSHHRSGYDVSQ